MSDHEDKPGWVRLLTLAVLALATAVGSAGLAAGGTAGALLDAELADTEAVAGLPLGLLVTSRCPSFTCGATVSGTFFRGPRAPCSARRSRR